MRKVICLAVVALCFVMCLAGCDEANGKSRFEFSYETVKSRIEIGETVEIVVTATNRGHSFRHFGPNHDLFGPATLRYASESVDYNMPAPPFANTDDATEQVFKRGETVRRTYYFNSDDTSPEGLYDLTLSFAGETVHFENIIMVSAPLSEEELAARAVADTAVLEQYPISNFNGYAVEVDKMSGGRGFSVRYTLTIGGYRTHEKYTVRLDASLNVMEVSGEYGQYAKYLPNATADKIKAAEDALRGVLENEGFDEHSGFYLKIDEQGYLCLGTEVIVSVDSIFTDHEHLFFTERICEATELNAGGAENFNFSLTWGCYGISSYDSITGKLVKTTDATRPKDYITTYKLTADERARIYELICELDVTSYPDNYNPHGDGLASSPPMTLILNVTDGTVYKKIRAVDIAASYRSDDPKGQKFLSTCREIVDILTETEEWKALPDYEFYYD